MDYLDMLEHRINDQMDAEENKEKLYDEQAIEIATGLSCGTKVNDGFYIWNCGQSKKNPKEHFVVAARIMLIGKKGYTPMFAEFEPDREKSYIENLSYVVRQMLKRQNGEYEASEE